MTIKILLQAALALALFLPACGGPTEVSASDAREQATRQVAQYATDRTDVPWQSSRVEDPDGIRSF
jgi:PBP1b-binding outer membrane lipoprotein LpoB